MHHAYLVIGTPETGELFLESTLQEWGVEKVGNPDIYRFEDESLGVDDARKIMAKSLEKAFGLKRIFVISAERFTHGAQNALLKTLEEPISNTHFFIFAREEKLFLPTLLSRVNIVRPHSTDFSSTTKGSDEVETFLNLALKKRLDFAKNFEDSLPAFLDSLLVNLKSKGSNLNTLEKVFALRDYASDPAVSARLVLEHLSLVL
jgi:DNA polymerase III delta prime subunit